MTDEQKALDDVLQEMEQALANQDFLSGKSEPSLGDLAAFGALRSIEGLPAYDRILGSDSKHPLVQSWYERTKQKVAN